MRGVPPSSPDKGYPNLVLTGEGVPHPVLMVGTPILTCLGYSPPPPSGTGWEYPLPLRTGWGTPSLGRDMGPGTGVPPFPTKDMEPVGGSIMGLRWRTTPGMDRHTPVKTVPYHSFGIQVVIN